MLYRALVLAITILAAGCIVAAPRRGEAAPEPGEVEFELAGPGGAALVVPVQVNDAGPFPFVLDSGATVTCVDEVLVKDLGLEPAGGPIAIGSGIRGGFAPMRLVTLRSVALGEATVRDLRGCVVDLAPMRKGGIDVRGLLGLNFLRSYRLTVDFPGRVVRLERPAPDDDS